MPATAFAGMVIIAVLLGATFWEIAHGRTPEPFAAVGLWYREFSQTSDEEVRALLHEHAARSQAGSSQ